ncbi:MAG: hypothetical protein GY714_20090 [Desulfobacterales bacterium]|nr:hypothetical protein [Desulfobacterales bacterium]
MRLENLYPNFGESSPEAQAQYVTEYRARRAEDMMKEPTWPKPKKKGKGKKRVKVAPLTPEEEQVMKLMGLKKKDVIAMRDMKTN